MYKKIEDIQIGDLDTYKLDWMVKTWSLSRSFGGIGHWSTYVANGSGSIGSRIILWTMILGVMELLDVSV